MTAIEDSAHCRAAEKRSHGVELFQKNRWWHSDLPFLHSENSSLRPFQDLQCHLRWCAEWNELQVLRTKVHFSHDMHEAGKIPVLSILYGNLVIALERESPQNFMSQIEGIKLVSRNLPTPMPQKQRPRKSMDILSAPARIPVPAIVLHLRHASSSSDTLPYIFYNP